MGEALRVFDHEMIYFVTNRCIERKFLMVADDERVNEIIRDNLRMAAIIYNIKIYGAVFMGNHFHLIISGSDIPAFMQYLQSAIARQINRLRGRVGKFWAERYSCEPILDEESLEQKLQYVLANPIRAFQVPHPAEWPGFISWYGHAGFGEEHGPEISPLPMWECLSVAERYQRVCALLEPVEEEYSGCHFAGAEAAISKHWNDSPDTEEVRGPKPVCHASSKAGWIAYRVWKRGKDFLFRLASIAESVGDRIGYPICMIPPGRKRTNQKWTGERAPAKWRLASPGRYRSVA